MAQIKDLIVTGNARIIGDLYGDLTGNAESATSATTLSGLTATVSELNIMDGVTATASEINKLDGLTATTTELNYVDGVTSNIQTQLNNKENIIEAYYGSDNAGTAGWYKVCTVSQNRYSNFALNLLITSGYGTYCTGLLNINTRCENSTSIAVKSLKWMYRQGFSAEDAIIVTGENTWSLYIYRNNSQHGRIQVKVLSKAGTAGSCDFILSNNTTVESTTPSGTVSVDGATVNYANSAGSSDTATTATKVGTSTVGSATQPVYISSGTPTKCTYTLGKSVPSDAKFTDTTYSAATTSAAGLMSASDKSKLDGITSSADSVSFSQSLTSGTQVGTITINGTATKLYAPTNTDTHYTSKNVVGSSTATSNTTSALTNGNVYLNSVENGAVTSSHKISGSGATTVTTDASGNIVISSTDNNTTYSVVTSSANGLVPMFDAADGTIDSSSNDWVLTNNNGSIGWYKLPANAFNNTTYSAATQSAQGLMSASDKKKLDGIATGANAYTHPSYTARTGKPTANQTPAFGGTATVSQITSDATGHVTGATDRTIKIPSTLSNGTSTAGLIKTTSTVTSNSGYTACPVINGVPYYENVEKEWTTIADYTSSGTAQTIELDVEAVPADTQEIWIRFYARLEDGYDNESFMMELYTSEVDIYTLSILEGLSISIAASVHILFIEGNSGQSDAIVISGSGNSHDTRVMMHRGFSSSELYEPFTLEMSTGNMADLTNIQVEVLAR